MEALRVQAVGRPAAGVDGGSRVVQATAAFDAAGRTTRALAGGVASAPSRAGRMVVRDEAWSVWDLGRMERARALADTGPLHLSSVEQAQLTDAGVVVLRDVDAAGGAHVFLVGDGGAWRRVRAPALGPALWGWAASPDGLRVALREDRTLRVIDLRDGREGLRRVFAGHPTAAVFHGERLYVGDDRGGVFALSLDGAELGRVDLSGRFDHATALAVGPDGALLVGTARSRAFVFR